MAINGEERWMDWRRVWVCVITGMVYEQIFGDIVCVTLRCAGVRHILGVMLLNIKNETHVQLCFPIIFVHHNYFPLCDEKNAATILTI